MSKELLIREGVDIKKLFSELTENSKDMALAYMSALRDKQVGQQEREQKAAG